LNQIKHKSKSLAIRASGFLFQYDFIDPNGVGARVTSVAFETRKHEKQCEGIVKFGLWGIV
jgi:hypothetical protein